MNFKEAESSQKLSGSYYTPYWLAKYIMHWVLNEGATNILEPSCGDGVFLMHYLTPRIIFLLQD